MEASSSGLKFESVTDRIIGCFFYVCNELGYGFLESVYEESLVIAMRESGLSVQHQIPIPQWFRTHKVGDHRADVLVENCILIEIKCACAIDFAHEAQLLHYLKSTEVEVRLLLNFGNKPQFRRLLFDNDRKRIRENPCKSVARISA